MKPESIGDDSACAGPTEASKTALPNGWHGTWEGRAFNLEIVLVHATECHLATLEYLRGIKSTPKHALARQQAICDTLVEQCRDLKVTPRSLRGHTALRLAEILAEAA